MINAARLATTLGTLAAGAVLLAPNAAAAINIDTKTTPTVTGDPATTCEVQLNAKVEPTLTGGKVTFKDGMVQIGDPVDVKAGAATAPYTFKTTGKHVVTAEFSGATVDDKKYSKSTGTIEVEVVTGINLGSVCLPLG